MVADNGNNRIQVFTAKGKFLRMFGRRGGEGLILPWGVAIDFSDRVFVSEWGNHCVSMFTSEGQFVLSIGSGGNKFSFPLGLAVDSSSGVVYVCDENNNRIQVF